jgi:pimeloyl-ACP methyl ester carboxylesterase
VPEARVNGVRLYYEEHGDGPPIACIHGTGSSALLWSDAVAQLARLGRVIAYDRRGHTRSERPEPYDTTSVAEHADDAAALLRALGAVPAVVIGRSYGGAVACDLALRHPDCVRALVLLEPVELEAVPAAAEWARGLGARLRAVAAESGDAAVAEALIAEALGPGVWDVLPEDLRRLFTDNGPAMLAEQPAGFLAASAAELATIAQPALLMTAEDSPPMLHEANAALAGILPDARSVRVAGGHMIDPADPAIVAFIQDVLAGQPRASSSR